MNSCVCPKAERVDPAALSPLSAETGGSDVSVAKGLVGRKGSRAVCVCVCLLQNMAHTAAPAAARLGVCPTAALWYDGMATVLCLCQLPIRAPQHP